MTQKAFGIDDIGNEEMLFTVSLSVDTVYVEFSVELTRVGVVGEQLTVRV